MRAHERRRSRGDAPTVAGRRPQMNETRPDGFCRRVGDKRISGGEERNATFASSSEPCAFDGRVPATGKALKAEATRPTAGSLAAQQRRFNLFRTEYNEERPHEALDQQTPASVYERSPREMPTKLPPLEYPDRFEVRYVSANGGIRWNSDWVNVSTVCAGEHVVLEEIDDGIWTVYFGPLKLGRLHERHMRIEDEYGRLTRHNLSPMSPDCFVTYLPGRSVNTATHAAIPAVPHGTTPCVGASLALTGARQIGRAHV